MLAQFRKLHNLLFFLELKNSIKLTILISVNKFRRAKQLHIAKSALFQKQQALLEYLLIIERNVLYT